MPGIISNRKNLYRQLQCNQQRIEQLQQQIMASQKLASLGAMACMAAHEFNNLLMPIINYAELALAHKEDAELTQKALEKAIRHGNRAAEMLQSMLGLARNKSEQYQSVNLLQMVKDCFDGLVRDFSKDNITVNIEIPDDLSIDVIPGQFQQVMLNLIINARHAMLDTGGSLTIKAEKPDNHTTRISVTDTGRGIDEDIIEHIFEPFFSTKTDTENPERAGTGIGLTVCQNIINEHKGTIEVSSTPNQQTTFTITLPDTYQKTQETNKKDREKAFTDTQAAT